MTLPKSHKNPAAAHAEHAQLRGHAPIGGPGRYGQEKGNDPKRKVGTLEQQAAAGNLGAQEAIYHADEEKLSNRRGPYGGGRYS